MTCANTLAVYDLNGEMQKADWETPALDQSALYLATACCGAGRRRASRNPTARRISSRSSDPCCVSPD